MNDKHTNPGLLYTRFYFDERYNDVLDEDAWVTALELEHEKAQSATEAEFEARERKNARKYEDYQQKTYRRKRFNKPIIGGFLPRHLLEKPNKKKDKDAAAANDHHFSLRNHQLFTTDLPDNVAELNRSTFRGSGGYRFELTTTYPGLLIGLGYNHQVTAEKAINGGFSFDYTTGLPMIPGSTVKGIIRAAFPGEDLARAEKNKENHEGWYTKMAAAKEAWLRTQLRVLPGLENPDAINLTSLEAELFDNRETPYAQPVFYDALVVEATGELFGPDSITPHLNRRKNTTVPARYHNPVPISFLKVMPGVTFSFAFRLPDHCFCSIPREDLDSNAPMLTAEQAKALFKAVLLEYGAGAKTRLNYGRFEAEDVALPSAEQMIADRAAFEDEDFSELDAISRSTAGKKEKPERQSNQPADREEAEVVSVGNGKVTLRFSNGRTRFYELNRPDYADLQNARPGERYLVTVKSRFSDGNVQYLCRPQIKID